MEKPWYKRWFGETYKKLYPHRDFREAECQIKFLLQTLPVTPMWRILDVGCGQGRHLDILKRRGYPHAVGVDLSASLLRDARARGLGVARADMRRLPFRKNGFDLVTSFFTSFGYFATFEEDVEALNQFVSVLKPGGYLFLDLINKSHLIKNLVASDCRMMEGSEVKQRRTLEGNVVVKEIEVRRPGGSVEKFQERVRLYELEEMTALAGRSSLRHLATFGDESGAAYRPEASPRMALLLQRID